MERLSGRLTLAGVMAVAAVAWLVAIASPAAARPATHARAAAASLTATVGCGVLVGDAVVQWRVTNLSGTPVTIGSVEPAGGGSAIDGALRPGTVLQPGAAAVGVQHWPGSTAGKVSLTVKVLIVTFPAEVSELVTATATLPGECKRPYATGHRLCSGDVVVSLINPANIEVSAVTFRIENTGHETKVGSGASAEVTVPSASASSPVTITAHTGGPAQPVASLNPPKPAECNPPAGNPPPGTAPTNPPTGNPTRGNPSTGNPTPADPTASDPSATDRPASTVTGPAAAGTAVIGANPNGPAGAGRTPEPSLAAGGFPAGGAIAAALGALLAIGALLVALLRRRVATANAAPAGSGRAGLATPTLSLPTTDAQTQALTDPAQPMTDTERS